MSLPTIWTAGMDETQKAAFLNILNNNTVLINRFLKLIDDRLDVLEDKMTSEDNFKTPEWQARQAYYLGRRKELRDTKSLFIDK